MDATSPIPPALLRPKFGPCLSLYVSLSRSERHSDRIRVKTLVAQAEERLGEWQPPLGKEHVYELMRPLWRLIGTDGFWQDSRTHRAVFLAPGYFTELFLPHPVQDSVYVGSEFLLRPQLAPPSAKAFRVLALHQDRALLFEGDGLSLKPGRLKLPSFDDVRNHDSFPDSDKTATNVHCDHCKPRGSGDSEHARTKAYYHVIAALLHAEYPDMREPIILVGTTRNLALFRSVANKLANINVQAIVADPDSMPKAKLTSQVFAAAQPYLSHEWEESLRSLHERKEHTPVEREIASIIEAALKGQVETLWMTRDAQAWGTIGAGGIPNMHAIARPGDEDLLNLAAAHVLRHRGHVYEVEQAHLEPGFHAIASLRYLIDRYQVETPRAEIANGEQS